MAGSLALSAKKEAMALKTSMESLLWAFIANQAVKSASATIISPMGIIILRKVFFFRSIFIRIPDNPLIAQYIDLAAQSCPIRLMNP
jgi:hypothetical protein